MRLNRILSYCGMFSLVAISCIKPYEPLIEEGDAALYVVSGQVTDQEGYQYVSVSLSSQVGDPQFIPVTGCQAEIRDNLGHQFTLEDNGNGQYRTWIDQAFLVPGIAYQVRIIAPDGNEIASAFDTMALCPPVGEIYYRREDIPTNDPEQSVKGIRFYTDLDAHEYEGRYFRWEVEETWEYHMDYAREWYYDGSFHHIFPPDESIMICWYTGTVGEIFTVSTRNLSENMYGEFPLHFIDNRTTRLTQLYSILLRQYALSETSYTYWEQLRINSKAQAWLYEKQPVAVKGNLQSLSDPGREVLGCFSAVSLRTKRIFVSEVDNLELDPDTYCQGPMPLGKFGWAEYTPKDYPVYYTYVFGVVRILDKECVDCRMHGGVNVKPAFWPE